MAKKGSEIMITDETVMDKIYLIRDQKVMYRPGSGTTIQC